MTLSDLLASVTDNSLGSLVLFRTELTLIAAIVVMLLVRVVGLNRILPTALLAFVGAGLGLWFAVEPLVEGWPLERTELFTGMLLYDTLTIAFRAILLSFVVLFVLFTQLSGIPDREDAADFYSLVFGATLGMCLMASANHLLTIFLSVEMASVPSYVLAGMLKGRRRSSEAALKYAVYGAGAAGVMLYGISLLAGVLGSCHLPTMAQNLSTMLSDPAMADRTMVLVLGGLMMMVGLAFKLSAVPFHFWCPDVFEGASAEVNAFLSVASKAAAFALLIRVVVGFGYLAPPAEQAHAVASHAVEAEAEGVMAVPDVLDVLESDEASDDALAPVRNFMVLLLALVASITCTFGNLAAYGQTNLKRLLAYSTIAHAGYMLMPVAAAVALVGVNHDAAQEAIGSIVFYLALYLFMNLAAFACVAFLRNAYRTEEIDDYAGLVNTSPGIVICLGVAFISLVGLPPLSGFMGKWAIFASLFRTIELGVATNVMWTLLIIGGLNTVLSLFYYLRVIKVMSIDPVSDRRAISEFPMVSIRGAYLALITAPVLGLGLFWNELYGWCREAARDLFV